LHGRLRRRRSEDVHARRVGIDPEGRHVPCHRRSTGSSRGWTALPDQTARVRRRTKRVQQLDVRVDSVRAGSSSNEGPAVSRSFKVTAARRPDVDASRPVALQSSVIIVHVRSSPSRRRRRRHAPNYHQKRLVRNWSTRVLVKRC